MRCRAHHPTVRGVYETVSTLSNVFKSFFHSPQKCPDNPKNRPSAPAVATPEAEPRPSSRHSARLTNAVARPPNRVQRPWGSPDSTRSPGLRCVPADPDLCRRDCRRDDLDDAHHFHRPRLLRGLDLALRDQPGDAHAGTPHRVTLGTLLALPLQPSQRGSKPPLFRIDRRPSHVLRRRAHKTWRQPVTRALQAGSCGRRCFPGGVINAEISHNQPNSLRHRCRLPATEV